MRLFKRIRPWPEAKRHFTVMLILAFLGWIGSGVVYHMYLVGFTPVSFPKYMLITAGFFALFCTGPIVTLIRSYWAEKY